MTEQLVIGGTFNPPHLGHHDMALRALESGEYSSVRIQVGGARNKKRKLASADDRVAMTRLTFPNIWHNDFLPKTRFDISYYDTYGINTVTIKLLQWYQNQFPDDKIIFGIGSDLVTPHAEWDGKCEITAKWDSGDVLFKHADFLVYPRLGYPDPRDFHLPGNFRIFEGPIFKQVSGTEIEERVRAGQSISGLVTTGVRRYIETLGLYKGDQS